MKYAVVKNEIIVNVVEAESDFANEMGWIEFPEYIDNQAVGIGWGYVDGAFTAPVIIEPAAPTTPTKEQLMAELAALTAKIQALE